MDTQEKPAEKGMEENAVDATPSQPEAAAASSTRGVTPVGIRSSPPNIADKPPMIVEPTYRNAQEDPATKSDSEAETIVLPGKDGYSPSKIRKTIKHEDESGDERLHRTAEAEGSSRDEGTKSTLGKRKRTKSGTALDEPLGHSSGLSSVPSSPIRTSQSSRSRQAGSNSVVTRSPSPVGPERSKARSVDRQSRESGELDSSEDDSDTRRRADYRVTSNLNQKKQLRGRSEAKPKTEGTFRSREQSRSRSPPFRGHRRSVSTQNASKGSNGLSQKKKRVPAPLLATRERQSSEYHSDDSEVSGSTQQRSSRIRKLATPATGDSATSNAKMPTHKKHRDNIGRTPLARACSQSNFAEVKAQLDQHPQDIDVADYAGNTPLQMAALEGELEIVKLLIERGCDIHCVNDDKETPLHDAVENDHLDVVQLLIEAGVNPNRGNREGEEPLDKVPEENDNAEEIREALKAAKVKWSKLRRASEDKNGHEDERRSVFESPRHTPPVQSYEFASSRRGRAEKTSNELLYIPHNLSTLRSAAGKGDAEQVVAVLNVMPDGFKDSESAVAAARGGHDNVLNLLFGLSKTDPDPKPIGSLPWEVSTPMLAAIGRENSLEVIRLLLQSESFNPLQKYEGRTYSEIAKQRAGPLWKEEEKMLRDAYEKNKYSSHQALHSPDRRRDDRKRLTRRQPERSPPPRSHKRKLSGPDRAGDSESRKRSASEIKHDDRLKPQPKRVSSDNQTPQKRGPGRPRKEDRSNGGIEDRPYPSQDSKRPSQKITDPDAAAISSDNDNHKARRRLVSGKDLKGEKDKHRRASIASANPGEPNKEKPSTFESGKSDVIAKPTRLLGTNSEPEPARDRALDRARSTKREESKDRLSAIRGDSPVKRPRNSATPPGSDIDSGGRRADDNGVPAKRRRLAEVSGDDRMEDVQSSSPAREDARRRRDAPDPQNEKSQNIPPVIPKVAKEASTSTAQMDSPMIDAGADVVLDVVMSDALPSKPINEELSAKDPKFSTQKTASLSRDAPPKLYEQKPAILKPKPEEYSQDQANSSEVEAREAKNALDLVREKAERLDREERERVEKANKERVAREQAVLEEEARQRQELAERRERQKREDAEAKEKAEAEHRRLLEEQQRLRKEEEERKHTARLAERKRQAELAEIVRLAKLPKLLRWFDGLADPKIPEVAYKFTTMTGVRYSTINPDDTETDGKSQWVLNTQVALLLGIKDLQLSQYTAWQRVPASVAAKQAIWHIEADRYCMTEPVFRECCEEDDLNMQRRAQLRDENKPLFFGLDLFFVKLSDLMYIVQSTRYLMDIDLQVTYSELPINGIDADHWKSDPGAGAFVVPSTTWRSGRLVGEQREKLGRISDKPFPLQRDPRRGTTFIPVPRDDPDYEKLAREQGLTYLLPDSPNTDDHSNNVTIANMTDANGFTPSPTVSSNNIEDQLPAGTAQPNQYDDSERQLQLLNGYPE